MGEINITNSIKIFIYSNLLIVSIYLLDNKIGKIPPIGKLLNPYTGYLNLVGTDFLPNKNIYTSELNDTITIIWDKRRIPHIFAKNQQDLYFAQGYIHAFDRLWQMEFQTMAAGGRLSEIIGEKALDYDRFQRRIGMAEGAKNTLESYENDSLMLPLLKSYSDGVNHYINSLSADKYPIEYKILDYKPEAWDLYKTSLLYMYMSWELSGFTNDLANTNFIKNYGIEEFEKMFSWKTDFLSPIIPKSKEWIFSPFKSNKPNNFYMSKSDTNKLLYMPNPNNGSNNFVISGTKTKTGKPILANDPHLTLNLPSIWYENHLVTPDMNVYGVSLLGAPGVVIGFNDYIAWGETNGMNDVMDFYEIYFKDSTLSDYWHDNKWKKTKKIIEKIEVRNRSTIIDTIIYTHHGPIVNLDIYDNIPRFGTGMPVGCAMQWLAHKPSKEAKTFILLNKAKNYDEYVEALKNFSCPGQNFIFASNNNNIAIWQTSEVPLKWEHQGKFIMDGRDLVYDWGESIPFNHQPHILNPSQNYLSSANQYTVNESYPYYYPGDFAPPFRGLRINELLSKLENATYDDLRLIQIDNKSLLSSNTLPVLLEGIDIESLNSEQKLIYNDLLKWDYTYTSDSQLNIVFDTWYENISISTFQDNLGIKTSSNRWPNVRVLAELIINEPNSKWFDITNTDNIENMHDIINSTFKTSINSLYQEYGEYDKKWMWKNTRGTDINHLGKIPGFGEYKLPTGGNWNIPNATAKTHGPSWRYVVELGEKPKGYGVYPGGQSGYPGSKHYNDFIDEWIKGDLFPLINNKNSSSIKGHEIKFIPIEK